MANPTAEEKSLATELRLSPEAVAAAREVLNIIGALPWPEPERVSLLARLAKAERADIGTKLGRKVLRVTPLTSFDRVIPILGVAKKRATGLVRALAEIDPRSFTADTRLADAWKKIASLEAANEALRAELDRRVAGGGASGEDGEAAGPGQPMRVAEVAASVGAQLMAAHDALQSSVSGLRLKGLDLTLRGNAATVADDVAMDFRDGARSGHLHLSFATADRPGSAADDVVVPDVLGYTAQAARRKVVNAGLTGSFVVRAENGLVTLQDPEPGTPVRPGALIRIVLG